MRALAFAVLLAGCTPAAEKVLDVRDQRGAHLASIITRGGIKNGDARFFHPTGQVLRTGKYVNDRKEGRWRTFAVNGACLTELRYSHGRLHDTCRFWSAGGRLLSEETFRNGSRHGLSRRWFDDGRLRSQLAYEQGKPVGPYRRYVRDGDTTTTGSVIEGEYHNGMCQGIWYTFTGDGRKMSEGRFEDNQRVGTWKYWDRAGTLVREEFYRDGALKNTRTY